MNNSDDLKNLASQLVDKMSGASEINLKTLKRLERNVKELNRRLDEFEELKNLII